MADGRRALTRRQAAILACIRESVAQRGYPPTVREIGATVGLSSTSAVKYQLDVLTAAGYIVRDPRVARTIMVLPPPALTVADGPCPVCGEPGCARRPDEAAHCLPNVPGGYDQRGTALLKTPPTSAVPRHLCDPSWLPPDGLGLSQPRCTCGWTLRGPVDLCTAVDWLMDHAYRAGAATHA